MGVEIWMRLHPAMKNGERKVVPFRTATMSTQIVAQVRDALFAKELRSGDFLGTEKDLAERFGVSRIVARDALRTLEAQGVVEIKVGSGGGARIASSDANSLWASRTRRATLGVSVGLCAGQETCCSEMSCTTKTRLWEASATARWNSRDARVKPATSLILRSASAMSSRSRT